MNIAEFKAHYARIREERKKDQPTEAAEDAYWDVIGREIEEHPVGGLGRRRFRIGTLETRPNGQASASNTTSET